MSLETLIEAARFLEMQELKQQRTAKNRTTSFSRSEDEPFRNGYAHSERERVSSVSSDRSSGRPSALDDHPMTYRLEDISGETTTRRRTNSNSIGPCILRSGTREVHNKLEKNRRAHLKECFEFLKKQLPNTEEKKTSNLSILGSAIRYIQHLRRKERECEHEMERLAREKISGQQRLMALKKELTSQWEHIDFAALLPEEPVANNDRETPLVVPVPTSLGLRGGPRYSSSSSLSSAATAPSPSTATANPIIATMLITQPSTLSPSTSPSQASTGIFQSVIHTNNSSHNSVSPVSANNLTITTTVNAVKREINSTTNHHYNNKLIQHKVNNPFNNTQVITSNQNSVVNIQTKNRIEPTSVKLVNGTSLALTQLSVNAENQKDGKIHPTQITLSQVVGGGGLVVSPIQLLTPQGIRVLGGTSGGIAATIELATSATSQRLRDTTITSTAQLHKLLVPPPAENPLGGRLPGGAELNLLPKATSTIFRPTKGLAIVNNGITLKAAGDGSTARAVHMVTPLGAVGAPLSGLTPLVVSQSQSGPVTHIIASSSHLAGKVVTTPLLKPVSSGLPLVSAQYLSSALVKPMVVVSSSSQIQATPTSNA